MKEKLVVERVREGRYGVTASEILDFAAEATSINKSIPNESRSSWLRDNGITPSVWSKLISLGRAYRLRERDRIDRLPANFSTLVLISRCSDTEINALESEGLIHPSVSFREIENWRKRNNNESEPKKASCTVLPYVVAVSSDTDDMQKLILINGILNLFRELSVNAELVHCEDGCLGKTAQYVRDQWFLSRIRAEIESFNEGCKTEILSGEVLDRPMKTYKESLPSLNKQLLLAALAIKYAYDLSKALSKDKRYSAKQKLKELAEQSCETANRLIQSHECNVAY